MIIRIPKRNAKKWKRAGVSSRFKRIASKSRRQAIKHGVYGSKYIYGAVGCRREL